MTEPQPYQSEEVSVTIAANGFIVMTIEPGDFQHNQRTQWLFTSSIALGEFFAERMYKRDARVRK